MIVVFIFAAVFGVLVFSGVIPIGEGDGLGGQGTVVLWGTVKNSAIFQALEDFNTANPSFSVKYVEKSSENFDRDLLEALASGTGPDMFFLPDDLAFHYANKISTIPYSNYSLSTFQNTFAGAGEVFLNKSGMIAFPMAIDPLVMYYNRSILDANSIIYPPASWDEMSQMVPMITKKDDSNKILKSAVSLGHFSNISHAKDIITALFMQTGNPILAGKNGVVQSTLNDISTSGSSLAEVLNFYTDFANPTNTVYSWNRSFQDSRVSFSREDLAFYFGYASELASLVNQNPNQNFLIAPFPQMNNSNFKLTSAQVTGLAISSFSKNLNTAFIAASLMATGDFADKFRLAIGVAPARRDLLARKPEDAYSPVFYDSALYARTWLDPSPKETDDIFRRMIDGVLANNISSEDAIREASSRLSLLLQQ